MGVIPFQQPDKVIMHKDTEFDGVFEFSPLEKGYAVTIGNSLRRILLSSLEGYAITTVKIDGVQHEYSTIKGVVEDVTEIVLNLKQVKFKANSSAEENERAFVSIKGKSQVTAGDIAKFTSAFEILNPDLVICNLEPDVDLDFEITIDKSRGYVPSENNNPTETIIGLIAIDSIHSPILNVQYKVEDFRVGQNTDFEKLIIELNTDGSIHPEEALKEAANILIQHFILFSDESILLDTQVKKPVEEVDESHLQMQKMLKTSLTDLELSVRAYNCLRAAEIRTLGDLVSYHLEDLLKFRNFGKKSLSELEELVAMKGLNFGMDISKFDLDT